MKNAALQIKGPDKLHTHAIQCRVEAGPVPVLQREYCSVNESSRTPTSSSSMMDMDEWQ